MKNKRGEGKYLHVEIYEVARQPFTRSDSVIKMTVAQCRVVLRYQNFVWWVTPIGEVITSFSFTARKVGKTFLTRYSRRNPLLLVKVWSGNCGNFIFAGGKFVYFGRRDVKHHKHSFVRPRLGTCSSTSALTLFSGLLNMYHPSN